MDLYFEQLIEYVLEILSEDQRLQVKAHLDSGCKDCNHEVRNLEDTFQLLPVSLPLSVLNPALKTKLNNEIDGRK
jgi:hypothetical protein